MDEKAPSKGDALVIPLNYVMMFRAVWKAKLLILAGTLLCAFVAGGVTFTLPKTYESSATLVLFPTPFKQAEDAVSKLIPRVLTISDYDILLRSEGTLKQVADKIKVLGTWPEKDIRELENVSGLRKRMTIDLEIVKKTATDVVRSPVIVLRAKAGNPEQARDLAQTWAVVGEEVATKLNQKGKSGLKDFVQARFDGAMEGLTSVRKKILEMELQWNDELERDRLTKKHNRMLVYEEKVLDTEMQIATAKAEIADLKAKLEQEPEKLVLWKSPPMEAVFLEKIGQPDRKAAAPGDGKQRGYEEEVLNETNRYLKQKLYLREGELEGMLEYNRILKSEMETVAKELKELRSEVASKAFEHKQLDMQEVPQKRSYDLLAEKLEQAKIAESEEASMPDMKIVADAVLPDHKIRPLRSLIVMFGACMGFALSLGGVLLRSLLAGIV